jgi:hypothetical protein
MLPVLVFWCYGFGLLFLHHSFLFVFLEERELGFTDVALSGFGLGLVYFRIVCLRFHTVVCF